MAHSMPKKNTSQIFGYISYNGEEESVKIKMAKSENLWYAKKMTPSENRYITSPKRTQNDPECILNDSQANPEGSLNST